MLLSQEILILSPTKQQQLLDCESKIEQGLKTFIEVGEALLKIRNLKLYKATHSTFENYCEQRWGMGIRQSQRLINASKVVANIQEGDQLVALPSSEYQIRSLSIVPKKIQQQVWKDLTSNNDIIIGKDVEAAVRRIQEETMPFNSSLHFSSAEEEWYSPDKIILPTLKLLGAIDLDPCSNSKENPHIPAKKHFTKKEDGLKQDWQGRTYLNPPYGRNIRPWIEKLVQHYISGDLSEAIALLPARTDTQWFSLLKAYPRCFIHGRLHFSEAKETAPFPSVVIYLGENISAFKTCFEEVGDIYSLL